jgi:hypothetical protein
MKLAISIPALFLLTVWAVGCLWFDGPESRLWAGALSMAFVVAVIALLGLVRPIWQLSIINR